MDVFEFRFRGKTPDPEKINQCYYVEQVNDTVIIEQKKNVCF